MSRDRIVRVEIAASLDPSDLTWPEDDDFEGASGNRSFEDLSGTDWEDVREVFRSEQQLLNELVSAAELGSVLIDLNTDDVDDIELAELGPTDFGTCAATLALNAAGCPTITACAGHVTGYPYIAFWTRPAWVPLLLEAAQAARIGLGNAEFGAAEVFTNADDLTGLLRLAHEIERRAQRFGGLEAATPGRCGDSAFRRP
jgi:hypothetical protein